MSYEKRAASSRNQKEEGKSFGRVFISSLTSSRKDLLRDKGGVVKKWEKMQPWGRARRKLGGGQKRAKE